MAPSFDRLFGKRVPSGTRTARFNMTPARVTIAEQDNGAVDMVDWFGLGKGVQGTEEVVGLGGYGRTLTVIRCSLRSDDDFDERTNRQMTTSIWPTVGLLASTDGVE